MHSFLFAKMIQIKNTWMLLSCNRHNWKNVIPLSLSLSVMINVPLQDDLCAHRLLPESLCLLYDLLFAWDHWTFYLQVSEGLKHFSFFLARILKKRKKSKRERKERRKERLGRKKGLHWCLVKIKQLKSNPSFVSEAYAELNRHLMVAKPKKLHCDR